MGPRSTSKHVTETAWVLLMACHFLWYNYLLKKLLMLSLGTPLWWDALRMSTVGERGPAFSCQRIVVPSCAWEARCAFGENFDSLLIVSSGKMYGPYSVLPQDYLAQAHEITFLLELYTYQIFHGINRFRIHLEHGFDWYRPQSIPCPSDRMRIICVM